MMRVQALLVAVGIALTACGDDSVVEPLDNATLELAGGNDQQATAGNRLSVPLSVRVRAEDGSSIPRARISWEVVEGAGAILSDTAVVSDGDGIGSIVLTLGPQVGTYTLRTSLSANLDESVSFTAQAVAAPIVSSVTPSTFATGDTVTVAGADITDSTEIWIDDRESDVVPGSAKGTQIRVIIPPCVNSGAVEVRAAVGYARSQPIVATALTSGSLELAVGDWVSVDASEDGCTLVAPPETGAAEYLVTVQAVGAKGSEGMVTLSRSTDPIAAPPVVAGVPYNQSSIADQFHSFLRKREVELARSRVDREVFTSENRVVGSTQLAIGDERTFRVCDRINCTAPDHFPSVTAEAVFVGDRSVIYQDTSAPSGGFTSADFPSLGSLFDQELYGLATSTFGSESDLDANGRVAILMTPMVNRLASPLSCLGATVIGYFMGHDIDPSGADDPRSNQGEVFYSVVPDPNGEVACTHPLDRTRELVPVTFIHEFQHMINFYQHVVVRGGDAEDTWLNEGMSQISEDLAALHFRDLGDATRADQFSIKNFTNGNRFLQQPADHFLLFDVGAGTGAERGAAWLFLRWLGDRYGREVFRLLAESDETGAANIERATGRSFTSLLSEWFAALYVSDLDGFETPSSLRYLSWSLRERYEALHGEDPVQFPRVYPLEPIAQGGDAFSVSLRVRAGSGQHVLVSHSAGADPFRLGIEETEGKASVRMVVLRLR